MKSGTLLLSNLVLAYRRLCHLVTPPRSKVTLSRGTFLQPPSGDCWLIARERSVLPLQECPSDRPGWRCKAVPTSHMTCICSALLATNSSLAIRGYKNSNPAFDLHQGRACGLGHIKSMTIKLVPRYWVAGLIWGALVVLAGQFVSSPTSAQFAHMHQLVAHSVSSTNLTNHQVHQVQAAAEHTTEQDALAAIPNPSEQQQCPWSCPTQGCGAAGCAGSGLWGAVLPGSRTASLNPERLRTIVLIVTKMRSGMEPEALRRPPRTID